MDELTLNCYIRSKEPDVSLQVKISKTETVFGLQEAIKVQKQNEFKLVAAHTLTLYKPKTAVSRFFTEHLSKLTLSEHAEFLLGGNELSQVFPEPPPKGDIHVIVDMPMFVCWLRGVTLDFRFQVKVPMTGTVLDLQEAIKNKKSSLRDVDAATLRLFRISGNDDELQKSINKMSDGEPLQGFALAPNFLSVPVLDPLLVVVEIPATGGGSPTLDQDPVAVAARSAICELHSRINDCHLKSLYFTKNWAGRGSRKRPRTDDDDDDIVDDSGGEWRPIDQRPDHILTVYRPSNPNEKFIAKKVLEESYELEILRFLDTIPLKSDHVIPLIDSFDGWAILPKLGTVMNYVDFSPEVFDSKVSQACQGLIKGLAYLHKHRIAHRDIKPDNLVVDENFNLKIIDFDSAMQVEHEDEEVDDQCGTKYWMAPEVEEKLIHSPIKADRWACGRVILFLLDRLGKKEESLRAFARDLVAKDPKQRPSLLEWGRYSAPPHSDAGNIENSDARGVVRPRGDRMEADDEDTRPPNVKKQRLDESG